MQLQLTERTTLQDSCACRWSKHETSSSSARKAVFLHWPDGHESIYHAVSHQGPGCLMPGHNVLQDLHAHKAVA